MVLNTVDLTRAIDNIYRSIDAVRVSFSPDWRDSVSFSLKKFAEEIETKEDDIKLLLRDIDRESMLVSSLKDGKHFHVQADLLLAEVRGAII